MRPRQQEPIMVVAVTPNEVIALQMVINLYIAHKSDEQVAQLLHQFQNRLITQLPTTVMPVVRKQVTV